MTNSHWTPPLPPGANHSAKVDNQLFAYGPIIFPDLGPNVSPEYGCLGKIHHFNRDYGYWVDIENTSYEPSDIALAIWNQLLQPKDND